MSPHLDSRSGQDRRKFLQIVSLTAVAAAVNASASAWAQPRPAAPAKPDTAKAAAPAGPAPISEDAKTLATLVQRRYGKFLNAAQLEAVTRELDNRIQGGRRLRDQKLANHEEPDFAFQAG